MSATELNTRPNYIDHAKILGMCMVIYAHYVFYSKANAYSSILDSSVRFILLFHMPLFFIISGLLYKGFDNIKDELVKIWKTLCVPYILLSLITTAIGIIYLLFIDKYTHEELLRNFIGGVTGFDYPRKLIDAFASPLWFVYALVIIRLLFLFSSKKYVLFIPIILGVLVMHMGNIFSFRLDSALVGFLFFCSGYYGKKFIMKIMSFPIGYKMLISVLCVLVLLLARLNMGGSYCSIQAMNFGRYPLIALLSGLAGTVLVLYFSQLVVRIHRYIHVGSMAQQLSTGMIITLAFHKLILTFLLELPIPHKLDIPFAISYTIVTYLITYVFIITIIKYCPILAGRRFYV